MNTIPYCGQPPTPGALSWNFDPALLLALVGVAALYAAACRRPGSPAAWERGCFAAGWLITAAVLISPLCNLGVALFHARVGQHMILALVAAPLLVLGWPGRLPGLTGKNVGAGTLLGAAGAFAAALWFWHLPGPYDLTLSSTPAYWGMHACLFGTALLLWSGLLHNGAAASGWGLLASFGTGFQMTLLGALLTFARRPLYAAHAMTTEPWGLTPLEDQQLGGLLMWVPAGLVLAAWTTAVIGFWIAQSGISRDVPVQANT